MCQGFRYTCPECTQTIDLAVVLYRNEDPFRPVESIHLGYRNWPCPMCGLSPCTVDGGASMEIMDEVEAELRAVGYESWRNRQREAGIWIENPTPTQFRAQLLRDMNLFIQRENEQRRRYDVLVGYCE